MAVDVKYGRVTVERGEIPEDEPVFILRAQDILARLELNQYLFLASVTHQADEESKFLEAVERAALAFSRWPVKKLPD